MWRLPCGWRCAAPAHSCPVVGHFKSWVCEDLLVEQEFRQFLMWWPLLNDSDGRWQGDCILECVVTPSLPPMMCSSGLKDYSNWHAWLTDMSNHCGKSWSLLIKPAFGHFQMIVLLDGGKDVDLEWVFHSKAVQGKMEKRVHILQSR